MKYNIEQILKSQDSEALKSVLDSSSVELDTKDMLKFILTTENIDLDFLQLVYEEALKDDFINELDGSPKEKDTLFYILSGLGKVDAVNLFLENGVDVRHKNGSMALMIASAARQVDTLRLLLEKGANVHYQDDDGKTALFEASASKYKIVLENLLNIADQYLGMNEEIVYNQPSASKNSEIIRLFVEYGFNIHHQDKDEKTALIYASENGDNETVKILLENGANIDHQDKNEKTALIYASENGHIEIVKILLDNGAVMEESKGKTALHHASKNGYTKIVKFLLENGADVNHNQGTIKESALHYASGNGHTEIVKWLLAKGADIHYQTFGGVGVLLDAASSGHIETVRILLANGADVDEWRLGETILYDISGRGNSEMANVLLEHGADISIQDPTTEMTALHNASRSGHTEIVKILLENGANMHQQDMDGKIAIHHASEYGHVETVRFLLENGVEVNCQDKDGKTALMCVSKQHDGAKIGQMFGQITPFNVSSENRYIETVNLLLKNGAEVNYEDKDGKTALIYASAYNSFDAYVLELEMSSIIYSDKTLRPIVAPKRQIDTVRLLLEKGADVNHQDKEGKMALIYASSSFRVKDEYKEKFENEVAVLKNNQIKTVELLLKNGADVRILDNEGKRALKYAIENGHNEIVKLLSSNGAALVNILTNFTLDEPIKYTTHEWRNRIDHKYPQYREDFYLFLKDVTDQVSAYKNELELLSPNLYTKIYDFIASDKTDIGWSSLKGLKEYMGENKNNDPFDFELLQSSDSQMLRFGDRIEVFKNEIEIRGNMLQDIFIGHKKALGRKYKIDISKELENVKFYTDVEYFQKAVNEIFEEIKKYAEQNGHYEVFVDLKKPVKEYIELHITHKDSYSERNGEELLDRIENEKGDSIIGKYLKNLCDWYIVAKHKDGDFKIDCFGGTSEPIKNAEGFTHIMRFYI